MKQRALDLTKRVLTHVGSRLPRSAIRQSQAVTNYLTLGRWMREHGFQPVRRVRERTEIFGSIAHELRNRRVLYLEFGVFHGSAIRYWAQALEHPETRLHGFDSFEGLPEDFDVLDGPNRKGFFSTLGQIPKVDDPRVAFFKGWFEETLPAYRPPEHDVLLVTLDADLYSSTICVLRSLRPWILPGTYLYFDDLCRLEHEPKAFDEFMKESGRRFGLVCSDHSLNRAMFQCVA
jgi:hypothetical protein